MTSAANKQLPVCFQIQQREHNYAGALIVQVQVIPHLTPPVTREYDYSLLQVTSTHVLSHLFLMCVFNDKELSNAY